MGLTPLEGLIMGTRSGDIDPAAIEYLMDKSGMDIHEVTDYLNKKSGVLGISGISSDFRDLEAAATNGNERAQLALNAFCYRVKKYIGSYTASLGGVDCIAFTGGIGENSAEVREQILKGLEFLGVNFDAYANKNAARGKVSLISKGATKVYIIPTNEELVIARETKRLKEEIERGG
jgi:acetate kinase